ncbi:MAG: transglycosylase SLT domain-containing protein [Polyangiaceae bacterium]|nr:transglycosylase SLT domain-containing protein [Polyangiaceae bacterium]
MRRLRPRYMAALALAVWGAALFFSSVAMAQPSKARSGPAQGKHLAQKAPKGAAPKKTSGAKKAPAKGGKKSNESKKAPKVKGSAPKPADPQARASIAGQPVADTATDPPELKELREVEEILFWDQTGATAAPSDKPEIVSTGLPPSDPSSALVASTAETPAMDLKWMTQLSKPDLPFRWDTRLIRYLDYFKNNPRGKSFVTALLKRSGRYEGKIREALKAKNLPEDLVYLALAESGMNPRIVSSAGAAGLWQFMPKAAAAYGLRVDKHVDERLDPHRSTQAAVRFLKDLHTRFGRWELAMAAYNMGHGGLLTSIRKYNTNDFWELTQLEAGVPYETALYVPKIVAIAFVARNKEAFGCADLQLDAAEPFEVSDVSADPTPSATATADTAVASTTPAAVLKAQEKAAEKKTVLASTAAQPVAEKPTVETESYTLRWGESLEVLAASYGMTESKLRALNAMKDPTPPRPGTKILVPKAKGKALPLDPFVAVVPSRTTPVAGKRRVFYEVVWGDKLDDVARVLGVTADELSQWNNLDRTANLHGKMVLQAFVAEGSPSSGVRVVSASDAKVLVAGSSEFFDYFESKNGRMRSVVTCGEGDTLKSVAKKYGVSVGMLERINHRSRSAELKAGDKLVVYERRTAPDPVAAPRPALIDELDVVEDRAPESEGG